MKNKKFIIQLKTRFAWEDVRIFYDIDFAKKYFIKLRLLGLNVRLLEVL